MVSFDNDSLRVAVKLWFDDKEAALGRYGDKKRSIKIVSVLFMILEMKYFALNLHPKPTQSEKESEKELWRH